MSTFTVDDLRAFGFSPRLLQQWRETGVRQLLPLQARAIQEYGFLQGRNLLVLAPTSSGKTFVAELAAMRHLEAGRRVIYLVPTKALAEEKGRQFARRYSPLGYRVAIATRERPETDRLVIEGRFDLLVGVYEKLKAYLIMRPELLSQLGLVVVDEIQTLGERGRGEALDVLLGKMMASPKRPQFIGLSAVLGEGGRLADWLKCDLLLFRQRPVELREGVLDCSSGLFRYRSANAIEEGEEVLLRPDLLTSLEDPEQPLERVLQVARHLAEGLGEQVLAFVPTRHASRLLALQLAEAVDLASAEEAVEELQDFEPTASRNQLLHCLHNGVAFHNADLSADLRALIESHYSRGAIRLLISTSTLGQGVNLTGRDVIQIPSMAAQDAWTGETAFVPLSVSRFRNQGGRAGRFRLEQDFGRSILLAEGPDEAQRLYQHYVTGELEPLEAPLRNQPLDVAIMDFVASGIARVKTEIERVLFCTYTGFSEWRGDVQLVTNVLDKTVGNLCDLKLLRRDKDQLEATGLGKIMALHGLTSESLSRMAQWLMMLDKRVPGELEIALILAATEDGKSYYLPLSWQERRQADYMEEARTHLAAEAELSPMLQKILWPEGGMTADELSVLKKVFLIEAWLGGDETEDIEEQFQTLAGTIATLAAHIHWLACALADAAIALGLPRPVREAISGFARRLPLGLPEHACGLSGLHVEGLTRGAVQALVREGYDSIEALRQANAVDLRRILPERVARELLAEIGPVELNESSVAIACHGEEDATPRLQIDKDNAGEVIFHGSPIRLTPLPFQLLVILAENASRMLPRPRLVNYLWPDQVVEDQQLGQHCRAILKAFASIVGQQSAKSLLEVRRGLGVRLVLPPEEVRVVPGSLRIS